MLDKEGIQLKTSHFILFCSLLKNYWSHILACKLPDKKHEYNFMTHQEKIGFTITIQS